MSETITAIAQLWSLALVLVLGTSMVLFRRQIAALLERLSKVSMRRGQTEVVIESRREEPAEAIVVSSPPPAAVEPPKQEETPKELPGAVTEEDPFGVMLNALRDHRFDDADAAFKARQAAEMDPTERVREEVFYLAATYIEGKPSASLERIEDIANANPALRAYALGWVSWAYRHVSAFEQARDAANRAITASTTDDEKAEHIIALNCSI